MTSVIYARYSSHNQNEQSIDGQLRDCRAFAKGQGMTIVREYIDRAMSGTNDERPAFQQMIKESAKGEFAAVIVWKLDRFSRNRYDSASNKNTLKKNGVKVVSATEKISDDPEGIIMESLLEGMAEYYSANLSKHIKRGQRESALKGKIPNGRTSYGYGLLDGYPVVIEEEAEVVRYVFEEYAKGVSKRVIMKKLMEKGIKGKYGNPLNFETFNHALKNLCYCGEGSFEGIKIPFPPIIDRDLFDKVQARLKQNKKAPARAKAKVPYLLTGKMRCGHCGANMVGNGKSVNSSGSIYYYYMCSSKIHRGNCDKRGENRNVIEDFVCNQAMELVFEKHAEQIAEAVAARFDTERDKDAAKIKSLERELKKAEQAVATGARNLTLLTSPVALAAIEKEIEEQNAVAENLKVELDAAKGAFSIIVTKEHITSWLAQFSKGDAADPKFRMKLIETFVNSVYTYDDKIVIFYNIGVPPTSPPPEDGGGDVGGEFGFCDFDLKECALSVERFPMPKSVEVPANA